MGAERQEHEQQQDVDPAHFRGKPPSEEESVELLCMILEPGDHKHLAKLLQDHPQMRELIIEKATEYAGSDTVGKALAMLAGAVEKSGAPENAGVAADAGAPSGDELMKPDFDAGTTERKASDGGGDELMTPDFEAKTPEPDKAEKPKLDDELIDPYASEAAPQATAEPAKEEAKADFDYKDYFILEFNSEEEKVNELVAYIKKHPAHREKVLEGVLEWDPHLFDGVMRGLAAPAPEAEPAPAVSEAERKAEPTADEQAAEKKSESGWVTRARVQRQAHGARRPVLGGNQQRVRRLGDDGDRSGRPLELAGRARPLAGRPLRPRDRRHRREADRARARRRASRGDRRGPRRLGDAAHLAVLLLRGLLEVLERDHGIGAAGARARGGA